MKKVFSLFGTIALQGIETVNKSLTGLDKDLKNLSKEMAKTGRQLTKVGSDMTKAFTVPIVAAGVAIGKTVQLASDLSETVSKAGQIFGENSKDIEKWASTASRTMGQTTKTAIDAASSFAIFGKSAGLSGKETVEFSKKFVKLSSDLSSFYNTSPEDAITAIGAAMRGENEPIRRYGVLLDDASLRQKALEMGIISTIKNALTPQQKVLAASELIFKQTAIAQGDFERTSDGLANKQRILKAQIEDTATRLGTVFLPVALKLAEAFELKIIPMIEGAVNWFQSLNKQTIETGLKVATITALIGPLLMVFGGLLKMLAGIRASVILLNAALFSNPFVAVAAAIVGVTIVSVKLYNAVTRGTKLQKAMNDELENTKNISDGLTRSWESEADALSKLNKEEDKRRQFNKDYGAAMAAGAENMVLKDRIKIVEKLKERSDQYNDSATNSYNSMASSYAKFSESEKKIDAKKSEEKNRLSEDQAKEIYDYEEKQQSLLDDLVKRSMDEKRKKDEEYKENRLNNTNEIIEKEKALKLSEAEENRQINEDESKWWDQEHQKQTQRIEDEKQAKLNAVSQGFNILSQFNQNSEISADNRYKKDQKRIESSTMSEEEKSAALLKLDEKYEKEKNKIRKRQAIIDKAQALFEIGVNTSIAIVKALPNMVLAGIVGGLGALQAVAVAARPIPMAEGGVIKSRSGGTIVQAAEAGQDELFLPMKTGAMQLADMVVSRIQSAGKSVASAVVGSGNSSGINVNVSVNGNFIGNNAAMRDLAVTIGKHLDSEMTRMGAIA